MKKISVSITGTAWAIFRVFKIVWSDYKTVILGFFIISLLLSLVPFAISGAQALLINELLANGLHGITEKILWLLALLLGASLTFDLLSALRIFAHKRLWIDIQQYFELLILRKRSEIDVATYENPKFNDLIGKVNEKGLWTICNLVENQFQQATNIAQVIMAAGVFLVFDWRFFLIAILTAVPDFLVELKYGDTSWSIWEEDSQTRRKYQSVRNHFHKLNRLIELKVFQNIKKFLGIASEMLGNFNNKQRRLDTKAFYWRSSSSLIAGIFQGGVYFWIIYLVVHGDLKIGTMTFLLASLGQLQSALSGFFHNLANQFEWALYASDIFKMLDTQPVITTGPCAISVSNDIPPNIKFREVSFAYPETEKLILRNINLEIPAGEKLAIVGLNGAGKSTLIKLLMRFYDPTSGQILVNDIDLRQIDRETWWSCIAVLFQSYAKYNFPIREVIALGRSDGKGYLTKAVRSAKAVDAHEFIINLEKRYNQMIGKEFDGGIELSGGQFQKLALAKSIYRSPRLMILDEPTASIDARAEAKIFEELNTTSADRTQIVISQKFSTVRNCDRICVLENGLIAELGPHQQLMANEKTYAKLFRLQAEGYR